MSFGTILDRWRSAALRALKLAARPVRTAQTRGGVAIQPYRGYGSRTEAFAIGRVFRQSRPDRDADGNAFYQQFRDVGRRLARRAVAGAVVEARFQGAVQRVTTDRDGYFRVHLRSTNPPPPDRLWHPMELILDQPRPVRARCEILVPTGRSRFVVISDIDDTVMFTGVANKLLMLWRLFVHGAERRTAFPGVGAFYRALHDGASGDEENPVLYVSRAPWGIYEVLEEFFTLNGIPVGPVLFLREWGITWKSPLPRRAEEHKDELIHRMLGIYADLPFVLVGDSGQHDPEIYRRIVEENPGRVRAVYIRNVSTDARRTREIEELAMAVAAAGSTLVLAADTAAMAEHAARIGLIPPEAVPEVRNDMAAQGGTSAAADRRLEGATPASTAAAVARGELRDALETEPQDAPPNVVVEPADAAKGDDAVSTPPRAGPRPSSPGRGARSDGGRG